MSGDLSMMTWPIRVQRWESQIMLSVFMRGNQLVVYHVAVCKCQDSNGNKNKSLKRPMLEKVFIILSPTSRERRVLSSTWDGKIIWTFSIAHSSLCIITLFFKVPLLFLFSSFPGDMHQEKLASFLGKHRWINKEHELASFSKGDLSKTITLWLFSGFKGYVQP